MTYYEYLVGVGSNLGDRKAQIAAAWQLLSDRGVEITRKSKLIESTPIGVADEVFVNGAFACRSSLDPAAFMDLLLDIEEKLGRTRSVRWGNRTIDLDILYAKDPSGQELTITTNHVTVPHPHMWEREFVIGPAREVWEFPAYADRRWWMRLAGIALFVRWLFAAFIPFGNDEAYYWDWGRAVQLSYFDHPPFVSWLAWLGEQMIPASLDMPTLAGRLLVPVCHFVAAMLMWDITARLYRRPLSGREAFTWFVMSQLVPAFSLGGIMLMPDIGLILSVTIAAWLILRWYRLPQLRVWHGVLLGVVFGFAGLSKYHAAFMAIGMLGWLLWIRRTQWKGEIGFWFLLVGAGAVVASPVFIWNAQNEWASFLFQGSRGVSGDGFAIEPALRALLGEVLFVGPAFVGGLYFAYRKKIGRNPVAQFLIVAALPLIVLLKIFSFTSQILPHWIMPSLWLLVPLAITGLVGATKLQKWSIGYGIVLCLMVPLVLVVPGSRAQLLLLTGNRPSGLGELTLWNAARNNQDFVRTVQDQSWVQGAIADHCGGTVKLAGARWFTVAQAAANLPGQPVVENLDPDKTSYYRYRTSLESWKNCPTTLLSEEAHYRGVVDAGLFEPLTMQRFVIAGHEDRAVIVAHGWHRSSQ